MKKKSNPNLNAYRKARGKNQRGVHGGRGKGRHTVYNP